MTAEYELLLDALRCALHGEKTAWENVSVSELNALMRLSREHGIFAMVTEAIYDCPAVIAQGSFRERIIKEAKKLTISQAQRTADFLLFYDYLLKRGLDPIVTKGIMCRAIYPKPDQRTSVDEDLLIDPVDFPLYDKALEEFGIVPVDPEADKQKCFEVSYFDSVKNLYIEVHKSFFEPESEAYGDCNAPFDGARERSVRMFIEGIPIRTFSPSDHLLYLILHAYKHFLHGGVGIRQISDICVFSSHYCDDINFDFIKSECEKLSIARLAAAIFRIGSEKLGIPSSRAFDGADVDVEPLLNDILSGGLYGVSDINRAHSSTLTIEAMTAHKKGRRRRGALFSVFLPVKALAGRYPYLKRFPWLLPAAWVQRVWNYVFKQDHGRISPSESLRIGRERIELMKMYGMIDE